MSIEMDIVYVFYYTVLFQFLPKSWFRTLRYLYVWAEVEFKMWLTFNAIGLVNKISNKALGNGDLVTGFIILWFISNARQGWAYLEDLWFQDLGTLSWKTIQLNYM